MASRNGNGRRHKGLALVKAERRELELSDKSLRMKKHLFLAAYAETANIAKSAKAATASYGAVQDWLEDARSENPIDADFAQQLPLAEREAEDKVEEEIRRRGQDGIDEPVVAQGELVWQAFRKETGEPLLLTRNKDGETVVVDNDGLVLELGKDYVIRPLTVKRYSDRLLLARARALLPERYGWQPDQGKEDRDPKKSGSLRDLIRRFDEGETGT